MKEFKWSSNLAYAIGLITTDGSLSIDGRHLNLTSKDKEQILNFSKILKLKNKIGLKYSSYIREKVYYNLQFGNVKFYRFLSRVGLFPNKTKAIGEIKIPNQFFADFLRGHFDGDGCTYSYWDPRWKSSFMFYLTFVSASQKHIRWLRNKIKKLYRIEGRLNHNQKSTYQLRYAKKNSVLLVRKMYHSKNLPCLSRKKLKIINTLSIISKESRGGEIGRLATLRWL